MKKLLFTILTASLVLLVSCGGPSAVEFNDSIVKEQTKLISTINTYSTQFGVALSTNSFAELKAPADSLNAQIDRSVAAIKDMKTPSGGEKFKESTITYFESMKKMGEFSQINASDSVNGEEIMTKFQSILEEVTKNENAFLAAQKEFAKDKNMGLK